MYAQDLHGRRALAECTTPTEANSNEGWVRKEVLKLLDVGIAYLTSYSKWVSPVQCVPERGGVNFTKNKKNELIRTRIVTGWRICIDYRKLNDATSKGSLSSAIY